MTENEQLLAGVATKARNTRPWGWPSLPEPVDEATPARAEAALGFTLPSLLSDLYLRTGDGGFGPEYGLLPLLDSPPAGEPAPVVQYLANRDSGRKDPNHAWFVDTPDLADWLRAWVDGTGWYDVMDDEFQMPAWTDFRIRTAQASAS